MNNKVLAELEFNVILNEAQASTQTGNELLKKYKAFCMANDVTCGLVNSFVKEASSCCYDNGVNRVLERLSDYITSNKTIWALASTCESINNNSHSYNYLNRNACKQVEKLLEIEEEDVVKYIKAGALKNVMYCESFRNIAKQVYKDQPMVESTAEYSKVMPISMVENVGDGYCFEVYGTLYKMDEDKNVQEAHWSEVSNTFRTVSQLLEMDIVEANHEIISIKAPNATYNISEANVVEKVGREGTVKFTVDGLRENNELVLRTTGPRHRNTLANILEAIAQTAENFENIVNMDNVAIYTTKNDRFLVIEAGDNLYSTLLQSNRCPKWTINENLIDALSFIKTKTNVSLSECYKESIGEVMEKVSKDEKENIEKELMESKVDTYKERIEALTEKFKNDPVKLAVLSKLAQEVNEISE